MSKYTPSKEEREKIIEFANNAYKFHLFRGRVKEKIIENIIQGKLAELSFFHIDGNVDLPEDWLIVSEDPDPGWDLVRKCGSRIQVKSVNESSKWVSWSNWYWEELAIMEQVNDEFRLIKLISKDEAYHMSRKSKFNGWYIDARE